MADEKSLAKLELLHPSIKQDAIDAYTEACRLTPKGVHPVIDETMRSFERSDALYAQAHDGKDNDGDGKIDEADENVTNAKAGQSYHNYGLALDFHLQINGVDKWVINEWWKIVIKCFTDRGFTSGANFPNPDWPHLEKKMGYNWRTLLTLHNAGKFIPGNLYVDLA